MKFYINGIRRGLGKHLYDQLPTVDTLEECDVFINNKHDGFQQVELLYKAAEMKKTIINIGSCAADFINGSKPYAVEKKALKAANSQLFWCGVQTTILNLGWIDTESVAGETTEKKMSKDYIAEVIYWVLNQPHRVKEITIYPKQK